MTDRPEQFGFALGWGTVQRVHQKSPGGGAWEVDLLAEDGAIVERVIVQGPRLPEESTKDRPQWCIFGFASHAHGRPVCWPVQSRLTGPRLDRGEYLYYEEVQRFRITIRASIDNPSEPAELEIQNTTGGKKLHLLIQEQDGVILTETPKTRIKQTDADGSILAECTDTLTAHCKDAKVNADNSVDVQAGGNITADATGNITATAKGAMKLKAPTVAIEGEVMLIGNLTVTGDIGAVNIIDTATNTPHHSHD